jgi:hypothetical protein
VPAKSVQARQPASANPKPLVFTMFDRR